MPRELTGAEESAWNRYQAFGTPDEVETQIRKLRKEAAKYRTRVGEMEAAAEGAPVVPDGGRVITKEEAERFDAFGKLDLKPEEVRAAIGERDQLKEQLAKREREGARDAAAKALGIEGKDLMSFAGADALIYQVREVEKDGEKKPVAYVKDAAGEESTLEEYGRGNWGRAFVAVLNTAAEPPPQATHTGGTSYTPQTGTPPAREGKRPSAEEQRRATARTGNYAI